MYDISNLYVTPHAVKRFNQRAKLFLRPAERNDLKGTMLALIRNGRLNMLLETTPFYKNKLACSIVVNGRFKFYVKNNAVVTFVLGDVNDPDFWRK